MEISSLLAISPIDGRYRNVTDALGNYFSEGALIKYRVLVEVEYFIALYQLNLPQLSGLEQNFFETLRTIYQPFTLEDARRVKEIGGRHRAQARASRPSLSKRLGTSGVGAIGRVALRRRPHRADLLACVMCSR